MKKSRFKKPYKADNKNTNFRNSSKKSGVYIIKSAKTNKILYVGYSASDLYRTMYRHFQSWNDNTQQRITYKNRSSYLVRLVFTSPARANKLEEGLRAKYQPQDNPQQIKLNQLDKQAIKQTEEYFKSTVRTDIPF